MGVLRNDQHLQLYFDILKVALFTNDFHTNKMSGQ